eukprot:4802103-Pleurochrysis_carterae.AAC.4
MQHDSWHLPGRPARRRPRPRRSCRRPGAAASPENQCAQPCVNKLTTASVAVPMALTWSFEFCGSMAHFACSLPPRRDARISHLPSATTLKPPSSKQLACWVDQLMSFFDGVVAPARAQQ